MAQRLLSPPSKQPPVILPVGCIGARPHEGTSNPFAACPCC